ncbi:hypothetical protein N7448_010128 [Penicillium atrosanguineum]|uniref:Uncharacterized protein n=1 Tax=Penicillium atrosanguineum TaxID=1132637 RepID=A0A9W9GGG8_9EURO|nr:Disease resistance protein [Penicillium atrosanguineum]KAJ5118421.1 hypothetical protein N7526_010058 [Penicillium atrosanguineum]KAJ5119459.1 hypothetical protein N7448_010128 [Penicillium atrosanguineum]KAJ5296457.1 Disease resistance protein [Penicillium atrosanguineum]KAJ5299225.1 hypothetical protein N7476_010782 [Penicillium atrosanguineum]
MSTKNEPQINIPKSRSWLVISGASTSLFCTVGFLNSFGVFEEYYASDQLSTNSQSTIAWLGATAIFFLFSISVISGIILDKFGPKIMCWAGAIGTVFSIMMTSLCQEFYQFLLAQGILLGISMALVTWPMLALVGKWINAENRGAALGIVLAGSSLGGVIWPIAIDKLLKAGGVGFPWTMRIVGFIMIPCFGFACLVAKEPPTVASKAVEREEEDNLDVAASVEKVDRTAEALALFKKPALQLLSLAMFITYFGMFSPFFYTTSYAVSKGFPSNFAFYTVSIVNGASFFGRVVPGFMADKYGKFNCVIVSTLLAGLIALCWTKVDSVAGLGVWSAAYGFASGGIISLQQACAAQVATPSTMGLAIGAVSASVSLSAMANVPISGALAEKFGYLSLSLFSGITLILGGILLIAARLVQDRRLLAIV